MSPSFAPEALDMRPPPAAWSRNVMTSLQTKSVARREALMTRHRSETCWSNVNERRARSM